MKRIIATALSVVMLLSSIPMSSFAANIGTGVSRCNYVKPKFNLPLPEHDKEWTVFYSSQGKINPNPSNNEFLDNSFDLVELAQPKMKRCWKTINPKKFGRKIVKVNENENSFSIKGPAYKAEWWNLKDRIKYWWKPQYVTLNYSIVITSKDDEKALEATEIKEGQVKRELKDERSKIAKIKEENKDYLKEDWMYDVGDKYISNIKNAMKNPRVDPDAFGIAEHCRMSYLKALTSVDTEDYYTKEEADKINKEIRAKKAEVLKKLAEKSGKDLITTGKIAELSKKDAVTFRLVINNNASNKDADKLSVLLANNQVGNIEFNDVNLKFKSSYVCPLPDRLQSAAEDAKTFAGRRDSKQKDIVNLIKEVEKANCKLTFTQWLSKMTPILIKDLYGASTKCCKKLCEKYKGIIVREIDKHLTEDNKNTNNVDAETQTVEMKNNNDADKTETEAEVNNVKTTLNKELTDNEVIKKDDNIKNLQEEKLDAELENLDVEKLDESKLDSENSESSESENDDVSTVFVARNN